MGDGRIIYYFESRQTGRYLVYLADEESGEKVEIVNDVTKRNDHYKSQRIPIVEISSDPYSKMGKADIKGISAIEASDRGALARALVNEMDEDESPKLYSFPAGKGRMIATLALIKGSDRMLVYSKAESNERFPTISYDYGSDTVELSRSFNGASKIRVRLINLAEAPPFFKG